MLSFMLLFNTTVVYADIGGDIPTPFPTLIPTFPDPGEFFIRLLLPDGGQAVDYISEWLKKRWSTDEDKSKDMSSDGNTVTFNSNFVNEFNTALQDKVHALDGYYLFTPSNDYTEAHQYVKSALLSSYAGINNDKYDYIKSNTFDKELHDFLCRYNNVVVPCYASKDGAWDSKPHLLGLYVSGFNSKYCAVREGSYGTYDGIYCYKKDTGLDKRYWVDFDTIEISGTVGNFKITKLEGSSDEYDSRMLFSILQNSFARNTVYGKPFRIFYSKQDLQNFWNKGRIYVPKLPSGGFKVNIKYINNTTNLPDITYNITTENKTETEIQNQYDTTINNYLNGLDDFTDGGGTTNPTPTPSGGGSGGDFGDGTTPTPKPDFTDGSLTDTNTLLQKILDKLTEFSASHDKLAKTITDYIQKNDGKLEEILLAIQALSDGKTETEQNGCKYDFTALSKYLTDLWNNSDQKLDQMVKLLEENNKYQQKLVDSLNEIKALLIADTVMDFFKDRSQETAEKAKDKFPTSIPWDISLVLNSMSAEPKNPKFSLPIKIESFKINETIDIDLSTDEWEKLAKTCRYILSVTFILFLIHLSRKLFSNGGDD